MKKVLVLLSLVLFGAIVYISQFKDSINNNKISTTETKKSAVSGFSFMPVSIKKENLVHCVKNEEKCSMIKEFKEQKNKGEFFSDSLTPYHHEVIKKIEADADSFSTEELSDLLYSKNSEVYLLSLEELVKRLDHPSDLEDLLLTVKKQNGDLLATSLEVLFRMKNFSQDVIIQSFTEGTMKNFESALSVSKKLYAMKIDNENFEKIVSASCKYKKQVDKELFSLLKNSYRKQMRALGYAGVYLCDSF